MGEDLERLKQAADLTRDMGLPIFDVLLWLAVFAVGLFVLVLVVRIFGALHERKRKKNARHDLDTVGAWVKALATRLEEVEQYVKELDDSVKRLEAAQSPPRFDPDDEAR